MLRGWWCCGGTAGSRCWWRWRRRRRASPRTSIWSSCWLARNVHCACQGQRSRVHASCSRAPVCSRWVHADSGLPCTNPASWHDCHARWRDLAAVQLLCLHASTLIGWLVARAALFVVEDSQLWAHTATTRRAHAAAQACTELATDSFTQLWRSGALLEVVIALRWRVASSRTSARAICRLLRALLPARAGRSQQQPELWYATSAEKQRLAVAVLVFFGGTAAAGVVAALRTDPSAQPPDEVISVLQAAAALLGKPPLQQVLSAAVPPAPLGAASTQAPHQLLASLMQQLDLAAFNLPLSCCYNPKCGATGHSREAGAASLKQCAGCKAAR